MKRDSSNKLLGGEETSLTTKMNIPHSIIDMILTSLPAKSLLRFKSVSKSLFSVISSHDFHIIHSLSEQRKPKLVFRIHDLDSTWVGKNFRLVSHFCTTDLRGNILSKFSITLREDPLKLMIPSCMGLVCFATDKGVWLCNPSIHEHLELPPCPILRPGDRILGFGFGYLDSIKGFKVVQLMLRANSRDCLRPKIDCWVLNLTGSGSGNRSWRLMREYCLYLVPELSYPAFVKETIYWKIDRKRYTKLSRDNDFLVAFDIREEKFSVITHPGDWTYSADRYPHIAELSGRLSMVEISDSCVNMWFLEDQDICVWSAPKRICTTGHTVPRPVGVRELQAYVRWNNGSLLVFRSSSEENAVVLYDTRQGSFSEVVLPFNAVEFTTYFGGLFPLKS